MIISFDHATDGFRMFDAENEKKWINEFTTFLSKWRSSQYILNLSSWEIRPEKKKKFTTFFTTVLKNQTQWLGALPTQLYILFINEILSHLLKLRNFYLVVKSKTELPCFCFTLFCDWSTKHAPLSQPIRYKTNTNRALVARASVPRFSFPAFPAVCLFVCLVFFPLSTLWLSRVFSFLQMDRFDNFSYMTLHWKALYTVRKIQ